MSPLTPVEIAVEASQLASLHGDPADRIIVATAMHHQAQLLTRDDHITRAAGSRVLVRANKGAGII